MKTLRLKQLLPAVVVALALTAAARAAVQSETKTFTHEAGGITFELPAGWKAEPDGEQITASPAEGGISIVLWVTKEEDFEDAAKALGEELGKQIKNLKFDGEPKPGTHNGMEYESVKGSGQIEGEEIVFSADLLAAKKPVIILSFGTADGLQKHAAEYGQLVKSIKKIN
ncbi:MAG: hypothetical protein JOZ96_25475 [Acidobacteria bacterium]|nr:hypothetical protein [Acidobacteriota bacterium]